MRFFNTVPHRSLQYDRSSIGIYTLLKFRKWLDSGCRFTVLPSRPAMELILCVNKIVNIYTVLFIVQEILNMLCIVLLMLNLLVLKVAGVEIQLVH